MPEPPITKFCYCHDFARQNKIRKQQYPHIYQLCSTKTRFDSKNNLPYYPLCPNVWRQKHASKWQILPTIWRDLNAEAINIIDQRWLPHRTTPVLSSTNDAMVAIRDMWVRGAPLIGVTAAYGMAMAMAEDPSDVNLPKSWKF